MAVLRTMCLVEHNRNSLVGMSGSLGVFCTQDEHSKVALPLRDRTPPLGETGLAQIVFAHIGGAATIQDGAISSLIRAAIRGCLALVGVAIAVATN